MRARQLSWWWVAWASAWTLAATALGATAAHKTGVTISRQHQGDMFTTRDSPCTTEVCVGRSSGTAVALPQSTASACPCQCVQHLPVYRDDMQICVEDIHECPLASFLSGTTHQKIPFVFLPLKGQIVYPSAEINFFAGSPSPICVVSGAKFLTPLGWAELRNRNGTDSDPPFRLFRDEGRTFLQWLGDAELRLNMEGRLLLVHLMCKDMDNSTNIFMPCVAFRVAGSPASLGAASGPVAGVREVTFAASNAASSSSLTTPEYAAIAVVSLLLGLIYVSSVLLYLHLRRRAKEEAPLDAGDERGMAGPGAEEGVVKNNPLLRHCHENSGYVSDESCCSEDEEIAELPDDEPILPQTNAGSGVTCALVHPCGSEPISFEPSEPVMLDPGTIERLPEGAVNIVETPEGREDRPETVRAITAANTRRKLYFNPAYFELELLMAPPPAALEFLTKIREVINIAKHKMAAKRFLPTLLGIPEENAEGSIRRDCEGCPGCTRPRPACCAPPESKHRSIRKWLEDVKPPSIPTPTKKQSSKGRAPDIPKEAREKAAAEDIPKEAGAKTAPGQKPQIVKGIVKPSMEKQDTSNAGVKTEEEIMEEKNTRNKQITESNDKVANVSPKESKEVWNDLLFKSNITEVEEPYQKYPAPPPPSVCSSVSRRERCSPEGTIERPPVSKNLMDAVIKEFVDQRSLEPKPSPPVRRDSLLSNQAPQSMEYEADSLDRTLTKRGEERDGMRTPSDYGDPEVRMNGNNNNLPMDEELTMRNTVFNKNTGNKTMSKLKNDPDIKRDDDHDYEVILMKSDINKNKLNLPDILSRVEGYSLVSEVYVNDGYSFGSSSSISNESCDSESKEKSKPKIKYTADEPGHLMIEVEDSPKNYVRTYDSDSFEPDTLDRKPSKFKINSEGQFEYQIHKDNYVDSLERPTQISLKTTGSFRSDSSVCWYDASNLHVDNFPLNRTFGSLREIFEAKNKYHRNGNVRSETLSPVGSTRSLDTDCYSTMSWKRSKPKILRPEAKQARRQRPPSPLEYLPPRPPKAIYSNEYVSKNGGFGANSPPLPPREHKPPLPPKNGKVRSISQRVDGLTSDRSSPSVTQLSSVTRGVLTHASGHSPTSSEYETVNANAHQKNLGRRLEITLQKEIQKKFEETRRRLPGDAHQRDKKNVNFRRSQRVTKTPHRTEDSGYLSSDSFGSDCPKRAESMSETDDSLCDGASESGAESIATDSFFFGKSHKLSLANSVDSGVCASVGAASVHSDTDSNISFVTVLPMELGRTNHVVMRPQVKIT